MKETWVQSLVQEDPTYHSNKAYVLQLLTLYSRALGLQLLSPHATTPRTRPPRACAPQQKKPSTTELPLLTTARENPPQQQRPSTAKNK